MAGVVCHGQTAEIGKRIVEFCRTADVGRRKVQYGARGGRTLQRKVFMPIRMFFLKQFFLKKEKIIGFQKTRHSAHTQCTYTVHIHSTAGKKWVMHQQRRKNDSST